MQITKSAKDEFRVMVSSREAQIFVNCMRASLEEIMRTEFQTRVGSRPEEIEALTSVLETALN